MLHRFDGPTDGISPQAALVFDSSGNLYGTTYRGGTYGQGTVFQLIPSNGNWIENVLYTFTGGSDGRLPLAGLVIDGSGTLYGTTSYGGSFGDGNVFELKQSNGIWTETVLYSFQGGSDGFYPQAALVLDGGGNLFGTTAGGGAYVHGTVFELEPSNGIWKETVLYSFTGGADGSTPVAALVRDSSGSLFGTTGFGGTYNVGVVFKLALSKGAWTEKVLYSFSGGADGAVPQTALIFDSSGNLYGATDGGGPYGTVFELKNSNGVWTESILHSFTGSPDGAWPVSGLVADGSGNLYGTTGGGGATGWGSVFELKPSNGSWTETILYNFNGSIDGGNPHAGLIFDGSGNLYGTTMNGGTNSGGVAFEISQGTQRAAGRPIVFAHGFCSHSSDWATIQSKLYPRLQSLPGELYPSTDTFDVLYDPSIDSVRFYLNGASVNEDAIPSSTRFFRVEFYEPFYDFNTGDLDPANVAKISVLNKAYELSRVIKHITAITQSSDVILLAHSMGGLVSRAYLENMASKGQCYSYGDPVPHYDNGTCTPGVGDAAFAGDVADLVTIDTPHAGTPIAELDVHFLEPILGDCVVDPSVSRSELNLRSLGGSGLVESLNYDGSRLAGFKPSDNKIRIEAVGDYFSDVTDPWDNFDGFLAGYSDDVVLLTSQSIKANLPPKHSKVPVQDVPTAYLSSDLGIESTSACWRGTWPLLYPVLHFVDCLGAQPYTLGNAFSQLSSYAYERPVDNAFATTALAKPITSSGATLNGTVNPNGASGYAYFVWGTDPTLANNAKTASQPVVPNSKTQSFIAPISGLASGVSIYFQTAYFNSGTGGYQNGAILVLNTLVPVETTTPATQITSSGATLNGKVNPKGSPGYVYFAWGTDPTLGTSAQTPQQSVTVNSNTQIFSAALKGLASATKYYFRIVYWNTANGSYQYGTTRSFKTGQ